MEHAGSAPLTGLLLRWKAGDREGLDQAVLLVAQELERIAYRVLRSERPSQSLETTALVSEAYLRLVNCSHVNWKDRSHFLSAVAGVMRHILVDHARRAGRAKRGGGVQLVPLGDAPACPPAISDSLLAVDEVLDHLAVVDARKARVVELRFFAGMSVQETAAALRVHPNTVIHDWSLAKTWLRRELERSARGGNRPLEENR